MKITFYYVRHGETLFNQLGRVQGQCDSPLNANGISQAEETASVLRRMHFDSCYASASERAWRTAEIICQYHGDLKPVLRKDLKEFDFGDLDGQPIEKIASRVWGSQMADDWSAYHGENLAHFKARTDKAFAEMVLGSHDGDTVLVVSHGSFLMHLMTTLLHFDQKAYVERCRKEKRSWVPNGGITVFTFEDGRWSLTEEPMSPQEYRQKHDPKTVSFRFVRHGETFFNVQRRVQGRCDSPLTLKGKAQAEETAEALKEFRFAKAYCSTSERARDTASIILRGRGMHALMDERLCEVNYGQWEGSQMDPIREEIRQRNPLIHYEDLGGEERSDVEKRIRSFYRDRCDEAENGDEILLVSHGDLYYTTLETLFGIPRKQVREEAAERGVSPIPNGGIASFHWNTEEGFALDETMVSAEMFKKRKENR